MSFFLVECTTEYLTKLIKLYNDFIRNGGPLPPTSLTSASASALQMARGGVTRSRGRVSSLEQRASFLEIKARHRAALDLALADLRANTTTDETLWGRMNVLSSSGGPSRASMRPRKSGIGGGIELSTMKSSMEVTSTMSKRSSIRDAPTQKELGRCGSRSAGACRCFANAVRKDESKRAKTPRQIGESVLGWTRKMLAATVLLLHPLTCNYAFRAVHCVRHPALGHIVLAEGECFIIIFIRLYD